MLLLKLETTPNLLSNVIWVAHFRYSRSTYQKNYCVPFKIVYLCMWGVLTISETTSVRFIKCLSNRDLLACSCMSNSIMWCHLPNHSSLQFSKESGKEVHEAKLRVLYVSPPQPPSPITESNEEGLSPKMEAAVDNGDHQFSPLDPVYLSFLLLVDMF